MRKSKRYDANLEDCPAARVAGGHRFAARWYCGVGSGVSGQTPDPLDIGGSYTDPFLVKYYPIANADGSLPDYRWAGAYSVIHFPGIGIGPAIVNLQLAAPGSKPLPLPISAYVNGAAAGTLNVTGTMSSEQVIAPFYPLFWGGDGAGNGDLYLVLQAQAAQHIAGAPEAVAFQASAATITWGDGLIIPAPLQLLWLTLSLLLLYALLRRLGVSIRWAAVSSIGFIIATALMLIFIRLLLTIYSGQMVSVLVLTHLALWLVIWAATLLFRHAGMVISPRLNMVLAALFAAGFILKLGGLLHPLAYVIDAEFHLARIREVAQDFWRYYAPPGLALAVMPSTDWKT